MPTRAIIREPRWPAFVAMLAAGCMYLSLPEPLSVGPSWLLFAIIAVLCIPIAISHRTGYFKIARLLTVTINAMITLAMIASLFFLIQGLPQHREPPNTLLRSAAALWITNVLVFALWYWKLDAGGPVQRETSRGRLDSSFLFPQMLDQPNRRGRDPEDGHEWHHASWSPNFMDYLFLAFNTSTAFSPTDTAVLSRWAKSGMMLQSLISLSIVALLAARAVNVL
jgi:hypothetical protein